MDSSLDLEIIDIQTDNRNETSRSITEDEDTLEDSGSKRFSVTSALVYDLGLEHFQRARTGVYILFSFLQPYFNVSNRYVCRKVWTLIFPWLPKAWQQKIYHEERELPDMYIPLLSWCTVGIISSFMHGFHRSEFSPLVLGEYMWLSAALWIFWSLTIWGVLSISLPSSPNFIYSLAWAGYAFINVLVIQLSYILLGWLPVLLYVMLFYCILLAAINLWKSVSCTQLYQNARKTFLLLCSGHALFVTICWLFLIVI